MGAYILRRLAFFIPVAWMVITLNFLIINSAPGGPVELIMAKIKGEGVSATERIRGMGSSELKGNKQSQSKGQIGKNNQGVRGMDEEMIEKIKIQFGLDKSRWERYWSMVGNYMIFNLGNSFYVDQSVISLLASKLPVSISLGLWATLITYIISIPLGIKKAKYNTSKFDTISNFVITTGYAVPGFLFAILLIVVFAGGRYWQIFPLGGLVGEDYSNLTFFGKILDYFWHMALPVCALTIGSFATLTLMTKNFFLEEINKQYVVTARAKGLSEKRVLFGHVFRNAMLIPISGLPAMLIGILFTGSLMIEIIFSLDGLGLLGYEAAINRDYPIMFGTLYIFTVMGLFISLICDLMYKVIDPRIDFESREV